MQETQVRSLGREDSLEERMTLHSNILVWRILWMEEMGRLQFIGPVKLKFTFTTNGKKKYDLQSVIRQSMNQYIPPKHFF